MSTPFQTALNVAGGMRQTTPQAILPKPQAPVKPLTTPAPKAKQAPQNAQVAAYGKAMNNAIKNTKTYK